jgi:hypothetical protein
MIPGLQELDPPLLNEIYDSMLLAEASGPGTAAHMFQGLGFPDTSERIALNRLNKFEGA